jgi:hypothetical protein
MDELAQSVHLSDEESDGDHLLTPDGVTQDGETQVDTSDKLHYVKPPHTRRAPNPITQYFAPTTTQPTTTQRTQATHAPRTRGDYQRMSASGQPPGQLPGHAFGRPPGQSYSHPPGQPHGQQSGQQSDQQSGQLPAQSFGRPPGQSSDPIQNLLDAATDKTQPTDIFKSILGMECYSKLIDPFTNYQIQTVAFSLIAPLLRLPAFAGIFDDIDLRPWATTNSTLPADVQEKLDFILGSLHCFPAYTEPESTAYGRAAGNNSNGNPDFVKRPLCLRLWPIEQMCDDDQCEPMHLDRLPWKALMMRACGRLTDADLQGLKST